MQKLTMADLAAEDVELLPGRETLVWDLNSALVAATNASFAVNAATVLSSANSVALQGITVNQH
ncbi:hypothetical protein SPF06_16435 [Sinomonas sp. JGH33]|uniref:Uncharacterized protein n=1 Tax=Sinomonas terricola TaxID=3110330 RepID=A0ABU5TA54_9MICC|nr:hypothetical protein [Sinomonas sp. JGH33]MEA5456326.1 hypothetical protein [Sinomonas sp. JGH33]